MLAEIDEESAKDALGFALVIWNLSRNGCFIRSSVHYTLRLNRSLLTSRNALVSSASYPETMTQLKN